MRIANVPSKRVVYIKATTSGNSSTVRLMIYPGGEIYASSFSAAPSPDKAQQQPDDDGRAHQQSPLRATLGLGKN
jgi:hypothetical protein